MKKKYISNWGNYPGIEACLQNFSSDEELKNIIQNSEILIPRGLGRCYGDSALSEKILSTLSYNRILSFDEKSGLISCESGVTLKELLDVFLPRGWFLPVTPGTKYVTVGGAIASDVHGKNHHVSGSFSNHLLSMDIMLANGSIISCSKENNPDLFWATCGGMGLTGVILRASFSLEKIETSFIQQETIKAKNIDDIMRIFDESESFTYSVAWIDCLAKGKQLGRSIMMRGEYLSKEDLKSLHQVNKPIQVNNNPKLTIPFNFPNFALNKLSVKAFNVMYYNKQFNACQRNIVDYNKFFYPLDSINNWNRIYGSRGFTQYQFVLPKYKSYEGLTKILTRISNSGSGSFLAVLKLFGKQNDLISFPTEGYTLALDFPICEKVFKLLEELDSLVLEYNGRIYLTKDARMSRTTFENSYSSADKFKEIKHQYDHQNKFQSLQSRRIGI
jgi:FAD/FMN-containing dehydrogenase